METTIKNKKVAVLNEDETSLLESGYFDDNGGETDGYLYIVPAEDAPDGAKIVNGYEIEYTGQYAQVPGHNNNFCGWSSRRIAYTIDRGVAEAIALEEEISE